MDVLEADKTDETQSMLVLARWANEWTSLERLVFAKCACGSDRSEWSAPPNRSCPLCPLDLRRVPS